MHEAMPPPDPCSPFAGWLRESFDAAGATLACPIADDTAPEAEAPCP